MSGVAPVTAWRSPAEGDATEADIADFSLLLVQEANRAQFVSTPTSPYGSLALRLEVREKDVDATESDRTQLDALSFKYTAGDSLWLAYAFMLDSTFPFPGPEPNHWVVFTEFEEPLASPQFALGITEGNWSMAVRGGERALPGEAPPREEFYEFGPAARSVWHEFLFNIKMSKGEDGETICYHREHGEPWPSSPTVEDKGANVMTIGGVEGAPVYPVVQIYRATNSEVGISYIGGYWIRNHRAEAEGLFKSLKPGGPKVGVHI
jgi:hypothetical protein